MSNLLLSDKDARRRQAMMEQTAVECGICLDIYTDPRVLPCGHTFCLGCLHQLAVTIGLSRLQSCAACARTWIVPKGRNGCLEVSALPGNYALKHIVDSMREVAVKKQQQQLLRSRSVPPSKSRIPLPKRIHQPLYPPASQDDTSIITAITTTTTTATTTTAGSRVTHSSNNVQPNQQLSKSVSSKSTSPWIPVEHAVANTKLPPSTSESHRVSRWRKNESKARASRSDVINHRRRGGTSGQFPCQYRWDRASKELKFHLVFPPAAACDLLSAGGGLVAAINSAQPSFIQVFDSQGELRTVTPLSPTSHVVDLALTSRHTLVYIEQHTWGFFSTHYTVCTVLSDGSQWQTSTFTFPYRLSACADGRVLLADRKNGVFESHVMKAKHDWMPVLGLKVGKPCWHAIEVPSAEDRARCFWLIEYNSMACCLELVRYSVYSQQGARGEKVKVWPPHPSASSKYADTAALSSASGCDWSISLGYYGYLSSACCHLAYDGADGVLLRSCDDYGSIFLFSAKTGVCVRKLFTVDTAAGLGQPLNFAVDYWCQPSSPATAPSSSTTSSSVKVAAGASPGQRHSVKVTVDSTAYSPVLYVSYHLGTVAKFILPR